MNATAHLNQLLILPLDIGASTNLAASAIDQTKSSPSDVCKLLGIADVGSQFDDKFTRRRVKAGRWIFGSGQKFDSLFIVSSGTIKTMLLDEAGNEQILSFPLRGDLLGIDGLHAKHYPSQAVAITDCELVVIAFSDLIKLTREHNAVETWFHCAISQEMAREHAVMGLLGTLGSEARVARFLLSLSERFEALGYSPTHFSLHMTRQEIGSYLGLTLETVSRAMSALHDAQFIDVSQRTVVLKNRDGLRILKKIPIATKLGSLQGHLKNTLNADESDHAKVAQKNHSIWSHLISPTPPISPMSPY
jgi:CRP/FNR family transcriptional regulator, anaerobic regulatory protein